MNIIEQYEPYYADREPYYHNFEHVKRVRVIAIEILKSSGKYTTRRESILCHGVGGHDGGHKNGLQGDDWENINIALKLFDAHESGQTPKEKLMSRKIMECTRFPYEEIPSGLSDELVFLVHVARDADLLGIIGIENERQREQALIGFVRELLQKNSPESLLANHTQNTNAFYDSVSFYTKWAQDWAKENLEAMREWQLGFMPRAIEIASQ